MKAFVLSSRSALFIGVILLCGTSARADIDPDERAQQSVIPAAVRDVIRDEFPGFALPTEADLHGRWSDFATRYSWLPYLASGDFNDDGIKDYAALLVGTNEWKFVIFQSAEGGGYAPVILQTGAIPGSGYFRYPMALEIKTVLKDQTFAPEGSDGIVQYTVKHDSIELRDSNRGTWLFQYANGRYTDFMWSRGPTLGFNNHY